ncbi:Uncharacterised protein [Actinobacillus equuli]|nr:Uncharacterised protein [Actinobacillus equuli]
MAETLCSATSRIEISSPFQTIQPFTLAICHHDLHLGNFIEKMAAYI